MMSPSKRPSLAEAKQVVAAILMQGSRVLICQRREDQPFPLQWEFPGGKIEPGESPHEALRRELEEELGIDMQIGDVQNSGARIEEEFATVRHQYAEGLFVELHFFLVRSFTGEIVNRIFHEVRWEERSALDATGFLEADRGVVERLRQGHDLRG
jgi:8-oxo-dGTP diphosphatase